MSEAVFLVAGRIVRIATVADLLQPVQEMHVVQIACAPTPGESARRAGRSLSGAGLQRPGRRRMKSRIAFGNIQRKWIA